LTQAGKTALDMALEKQQGPTAALLAEVLANRGILANTPSGDALAIAGDRCFAYCI